MRVGVVGINHKLADLKLREQLARSCQKYFGVLESVHDHHYFILLSTCNRTEVYFSSPDLASTHSYLLSVLRTEVEGEFDHKLYSYFGIDCFSHLTRVTMGLDSAIIAETEIQGQVKLAYENSAACHELPGDVHFLFQKALGISKKLRADMQLGRGMPHLEHAVFQIGKQTFLAPEHARVLFVGASEINRKILLFLKAKHFRHLALCNRSDDHASALAELYGVERVAWSQLNSWQDYDWIIFGTKSPDYLITEKELRQRPRQEFLSRKLIMDLCVPRNVEPKFGQNAHITLLNIDQINRLLNMRHQRMTDALIEAERRVVRTTNEHAARYIEKKRPQTRLLAETA